MSLIENALRGLRGHPRSPVRQQKFTSPAAAFGEKQIVNVCSGFSGARNFTVRMPVS